MKSGPESRETFSAGARELRMADLLPADVSTCEVQGDVEAEALYSEEQALISRAIAQRHREFALGRMCARHAMHKLGVPPCPSEWPRIEARFGPPE